MRENENECRKMPAVGKFMETPKSGDEEVIPAPFPWLPVGPQGLTKVSVLPLPYTVLSCNCLYLLCKYCDVLWA